NERNDTHLLDFKCSPHKSDLIENSFLLTLKTERTTFRMVSVEENNEIEIEEKGMKVPNGQKTFDCCQQFLWTLTHVLSPTGPQKYGVATNFSAWTILKERNVKLIPIQGSRFHIYSLNSL